MFYRVEAVRSLSGTQDYDPGGEIVMTTRSRRHGDVCRAIYHYLLAGYWVRILDGDNLLIGGPFHPGAVLPVPFKAFAHAPDRNERSKTTLDTPIQSPQTSLRADSGEERPSLHPSH